MPSRFIQKSCRTLPSTCIILCTAIAACLKSVPTVRPGSSVAGRPIYMLETTTPADRYIVLIGRQHPPEITGALGMKHFINRIVRDEPLANAFRKKYGLLMVPDMSSDNAHFSDRRQRVASYCPAPGAARSMDPEQIQKARTHSTGALIDSLHLLPRTFRYSDQVNGN